MSIFSTDTIPESSHKYTDNSLAHLAICLAPQNMSPSVKIQCATIS